MRISQGLHRALHHLIQRPCGFVDLGFERVSWLQDIFESLDPSSGVRIAHEGPGDLASRWRSPFAFCKETPAIEDRADAAQALRGPARGRSQSSSGNRASC